MQKHLSEASQIEVLQPDGCCGGGNDTRGAVVHGGCGCERERGGSRVVAVPISSRLVGCVHDSIAKETKEEDGAIL